MTKTPENKLVKYNMNLEDMPCETQFSLNNREGKMSGKYKGNSTPK